MALDVNNVKLKLSTNLKYKNYLSAQAAYNRLSLLDYSDCNNLFANCCNCCGVCDCCDCLAGFYITIQGWEDGDCDCLRMNFINFFVPITIGADNEDYACYKTGSGSPPTTLATGDCIILPYVTWELYCNLGRTYLTITEQEGEFVKIVRTVEIANCDELGMDPGNPDICIVSNTSNNLPACSNCPNVLISATPVFGGEYAPDECKCCRPDRCEASEEGCINPYPETLSMRVVDDCNGTINLTLERTVAESGICWVGTYETLCEECPGDGNNMLYIVEVSLCCVDSYWDLILTVISPDSCSSDLHWTTNPNLIGVDIAELILDSCDPIEFHTYEGRCSNCVWRSCADPDTDGIYCIANIMISEDGSYL